MTNERQVFEFGPPEEGSASVGRRSDLRELSLAGVGNQVMLRVS
jgi:hypothetical protein